MPRLSRKVQKQDATCRRCALCGLLMAVLGLLGVLGSGEAALGIYVTMGSATARSALGLAAGPTTTTTLPSTSTTITTTVSSTDVTRAQACLRLTTPGLNLSYPTDAEAHFAEVTKALARWRDFAEKYFLERMKNKYHCGEGYCGPWVENQWIARCNKLLEKGQKLSDIFGPYIPILVPFADTWVANVFEYEAMIDTLKRVLRPTVPYVALVQHATGLVASREKCSDVNRVLPNLLVISSGGYGHVPVPLFKQYEGLNKFTKPMAERTLLTNYMGSRVNAPHNMREQMIKTVEQTATGMGGKQRVYIGFGGSEHWHRVMGDSRVSLCPRGYGRTSFRVAEALQMGHVCVHIYLDAPWLPYRELFPSVGFNTTVEGLPQLMEQVDRMSNSSLEAMEARIRELRESHFTVDGALNQSLLFLTGREGGGDLRCQALHKTMN